MKSLPKPIYLDYNATHPPFVDLVNKAYEEYQNEFFNPSGISRFSNLNQGKIESARKYFSQKTGFPLDSLVFTSTGTESNYFLLQSLRQEFSRVLVSPFEHACVWQALEDLGFDYQILRTTQSGLIELEEVEEILKEDPRPIVILYASNETGVIQPLEKLGEIAKRFGVGIYSDLMQAYGKLEINYDLLAGFTCSGHKIGAGMGSGLVGYRNLPKSIHIFGGGNQENGHRSGTENLPAILAFRNVSEFRDGKRREVSEKLRTFRDLLETNLEKMEVEIVAKNSLRLPNTSYVIFPLEDIDFLLMGWEEKGFCVATGASCKSRSREASLTLLRMGYNEEEALRAIRISTGYFTSESEILSFLDVTKTLVGSLV